MCPRKFRRVSCLALIFVLVGFLLVFPTSAYGLLLNTDLSNANASFIGERDTALSGWSVASAGDVNRDGYDDFLVGAVGDSEGGGLSYGQTYLILGKATADWGKKFDLGNANASFIGEQWGWSGNSVASAGDVNNDGYDDFLIGAPLLMSGFVAGKAYLILGKADADWGNDVNLANADASFISETWNWSGWSVASAGDVNGDGYDDFLIGAPTDGTGGTTAGKTYLILGKANGWVKNFDLVNANFSFIGERDDAYSGRSVASAGDVNGDGRDDFLIGAHKDTEGGTDAGKTYLILGKAAPDWGKDFNLANADASFIGEDADDLSGFSVASAGDVNRDGYDDFLIGASGDEEGGLNAGKTYLILGKANGWVKNFNLVNADFSFIGEDADDASGTSVASAGDMNSDGYDDFLIGASGDEEGGLDAGKTYLILGKADADWGKDFNLVNADASFIGEDADDCSGTSVASAGDVNGDGRDDFLIGAPFDSEGGSSAGQTYLLLGTAPPVGGEVYYVNKGNVLAPWLVLAAAIIAGGIILRRRISQG